ncbi:MAG: type IV pilus biogenesis/stability protein PilW [Casimicrobiaceae bacterium]
MRRIAIPLVVAVALLAACASKEPVERPAASQAAPQQAAPQPRLEPVKVQEATPQQRAVIRTDLAAGYYERGQFDVAIDVLKEAEQLDANNPRIYDVYGLVYTMLGEPQKAETSFRRALSLAPNNPDIRANWGAFLCATGRERESIPEFEAAVRDPLYKTPEIAFINAGKCTLALGDSKKADEYFRLALTAAPSNATASYQLALLAYKETRVQDARFWLRPAVQATQPRPDALLLGVCIERKLGDRQAELSFASQLKNRYPDAPETRQIDSGNCG